MPNQSTGRMPAVDRFWPKVNKDGPVPAHRPEIGPCWVWTGASQREGYGRFRRDDHSMIGAHSFSYTLHYGPFTPGLFVLHHCDNRPCVRPTHLFVGTQADNGRDMSQKGRSASGERNAAYVHPERRPRGEQHGQARLTADQVREIRCRYAAGAKKKHLARQFGISSTAVTYIVIRRTWTHIA